jgi:two-component system, NtrC family, sensor kinase
MDEFYRVPALTLLSMLLVVFVLLYLQARTARRLLWLLGWSLVLIRLATEVAGVHASGVGLALSNIGLALASLMFLGSMSPIGFVRAPKILYAYAFAVPLLLYTIIISFNPQAGGALRIVLILCAIGYIYVATLWGMRKRLLPPWFTTAFPVLIGAVGIWLTWQGEYMYVLYLAQSASNLMTALLVAASYRRLSPGVIFTTTGFLLWSMPIVLDSIFVGHRHSMATIGSTVNLIKVATAVGMILLVLEDELAQNNAAKERDHRARVELERYSAIDLSLLAEVHTDAAYQHACEVITQVSRFDQAALFFRSVENNFHLAAHSGMENELVDALEALGKRVTHEQADIFEESNDVSKEIGNTLLLDLRSLFEPDDALERLGYVKVHAIPMLTRRGTSDGALFLSGLKRPEEALLADDLLPLELLVSRLTAMRENNMLMQRVARSEKLAGLGQLAAGVAHELNNPLTVILGYSELLEETLEDHPSRDNLSHIRREAQRMRQIIESMVRFWRKSPVEHISVSLAEVLRDSCRSCRPDFDRRRVELLLHIPDDLPQIHGNRNQLQQMFLQILSNALEAFADTFDSNAPPTASVVRVEANYTVDRLKILISDNGPGFADLDRVFDPFFTTKQPRAGTGMGLSVCYAIVRDHGGEITAHNLQPRGALISIEFPTASARHISGISSEAVAL